MEWSDELRPTPGQLWRCPTPVCALRGLHGRNDLRHLSMDDPQTNLLDMWRRRVEYLLRWTGSEGAPLEGLLRLAGELPQMSPPQLASIGMDRGVTAFDCLLEEGRYDDAARELVGATSTMLRFEHPDDLVIVGVESDYAKGTYSGPTVAHATLGAWLSMLLAICDKVSRDQHLTLEQDHADDRRPPGSSR